MLHLKQIHTSKDKDLYCGISILHKYIPHNLCINSNELIYWIDNYNEKFTDKMYVYVIKSNDDVIGYLQFTHFIDTFVFLDYLIIEKGCRNKTTMKYIYDLIYTEINKTQCNSIILECGNEMNQHDAIVRLYKIMGFKKFNIDYKEPKINIDLQNQLLKDSSIPLLSWQELPSVLMTNDEKLIAYDVIKTIYFDHYLRWYSLYEMNYTDYITFLNTLLSSYIINYTIRELTESDIKECAEFIVNTYQQDGIWLNWTVEQTIKDLEIVFDNPKYKEKYFVAELNNEIIGVAGVGESFMTSNAFELCYATIKHKYHRNGIGTALTLKRIDYVKSIKEHGYIFVSSRYPKFFDKLGFIYLTQHNNDDGGFCCLKF